MSFCEKCGKQLAEGEVCSCQKTTKKKNNPAIIVLAIFAIAIVALVVVLILNADGGSSKSKKDDKEEKSSYMDPIDNYIAVVNKRNADYIAYKKALLPEFSTKKFVAFMEALTADGEYKDYLEDANEDLSDYYEDCDEKFEGWKISFKKESAEKVDADDLEDYQEDLEEYYEDELEYSVEALEESLEDEDALEDFADALDIDEKDAIKVAETMLAYMKAYEELKTTAGYEVTGKFILKAGGETYETDSVTFLVLKVNGSWVYGGIMDYNYPGFGGDAYNMFNFFFREIRSDKLYIDMWFQVVVYTYIYFL